LRSGMGTCSRGGCGHEASRKLLAATHAATWARAWPGLGPSRTDVEVAHQSVVRVRREVTIGSDAAVT
jgi:hypothetical protein